MGGVTGCGDDTTTSKNKTVVVNTTTEVVALETEFREIDTNSSQEENSSLVAIVTPMVEEESTEEVYIRRETQVQRVESEPETLSEHALIVSGDIMVKKTLTTDGPLGDVVSFGTLSAEPRSLNISGKISSSNDLGNAVIRSFDYKSTKENNTFSQIRALKVEEYLNTALLDEYYLLSNDGQALHLVQDQNDTNLTLDNVVFSFNDNRWTISGDKVEIDLPIKVEGSLDINTTNLFVKGTLMVEGDLNASGELKINTGTPFSKALIDDNRTEVDKLVMIGQLHGSGDFVANGEVNIMGNAELDGDVTLYGDAKINFLDNIYKAALYEAQENANETNSTMSLVHSQLFSNVKGKNSVVLFTFVEGDYIINENTLFELIEHNQTDKFNFKSYLYGATIDYGAELQKLDTLSPYYENKLALINKFKADGYEKVKIIKSIDIAPSALYHSFEDENGEKLGTYQLYSLTTPFNIDTLNLLTEEQKNSAIYLLEHKDEIEAEQKIEIDEHNAELRQNIIDNNETNLSIKSAMLLEIDADEANASAIDEDELKLEVMEDRIHEWVEYKELASDLVEVNATEVDIEYANQLHSIIDMNITIDDANVTEEEVTELRGWRSRWRRRIRRHFRRVTFTDCKKKYSSGYISGVRANNRWDRWSRDITIYNNNNYCTPTAISMIMEYHHNYRKRKGSLYGGNKRLSSNNPQSARMARAFHTSATSGTSWWRYAFEIPYDIRKEIRRLRMGGYAYTWYTSFWNRSSQHNRTKWYINRNNPIMFNAMKGTKVSGYGRTGNHSMPIIGYKHSYYKGSCWKRVMPDKRWLYVDTEYNHKGYIRFDARGNYFRFGTITYVRVY
jgi:cytoskeletal protein CcmA (bactofilin family)